MKKSVNKKISTTFSINPEIMKLIKEQEIKNQSRLIEWLLLNHFKQNNIDVKNIIL